MPFRILSLDGGGAWALIQVRTLITLYGESTPGQEILRNFDLVAANSGGSLVLAGLVEDLAPGKLLQYFLDETKRRSMFSPTARIVDRLLNAILGVGPKYSASAKLPAIQQLLPKTGDIPLAGSMHVFGPNGLPVHLLIIGFDYDRNRAVFFRSAFARRQGWGHGQPADVTLAAAVHASTNAPVNYFDAPARVPGAVDRFWDGGITGCNNPVVAAITEAAVLGHSLPDIRILSIGTGTVSLPLASPDAAASPLEATRPSPSLMADLKKLATAILDDPPDAATFIAHAMTGADSGLELPVISRVVRMSPLISPFPKKGGVWTPPIGWTAAQFQHICSIDIDAVTQADIQCIDDYCALWLADAAPNQPIRANGTTFDPQNPEIGYATFSEAREAWTTLFPVVGAEV